MPARVYIHTHGQKSIKDLKEAVRRTETEFEAATKLSEVSAAAKLADAKKALKVAGQAEKPL